jgi:hypothetical protein
VAGMTSAVVPRNFNKALIIMFLSNPVALLLQQHLKRYRLRAQLKYDYTSWYLYAS